MSFLKKCAAMVMLSIMFSGTIYQASANQILIEDIIDNDLGYVISSSDGVVFRGYIGPLSSSDDFATGFELSNSGVGTEAATMNFLAGTSFVDGDVTQTAAVDLDASSIEILTEYFSLKVGKFTAFFQNLLVFPIVLNLEYDEIEGRPGSGLSHISEYGEIQAIPLPAAAWLFLSALAGLGFFGWRKRQIAT